MDEFRENRRRQNKVVQLELIQSVNTQNINGKQTSLPVNAESNEGKKSPLLGQLLNFLLSSACNKETYLFSIYILFLGVCRYE